MFKILSIDGGGIKGLYSASLIAYLEQHYKKQVADCFDLITGTSTGGILAIALANRIPAINIVRFYEKWGKQIFSFKPWSVNRLLQKVGWDISLIRTKYNNKNLIAGLKEVFENKKLSDILIDDNSPGLCVPAIEVTTGKPKIFKTPHDKNLWHDAKYPLWEVALATSSAPMYFPFAKSNSSVLGSEELFIDGGLYANNPGLVGLIEAMTYYGRSINDISLLSVGNIRTNVTFSSNTYLRKGLLLWGKKIVSMAVETQAMSTDNILRLIFHSQNIPDQYLRVESVAAQNQKNLTKLDCITNSNIIQLKNVGYNKAKEICNFSLITNLFK